MMDLIASIPAVRIAVLLGLFALVVVIALAGLNFTSKRIALRGQLREIAQSSFGHSGESLSQRPDSAWDRLVQRIEAAGLDLTDTKGEALRQKLIAAGYESSAAPQLYTLIRLALVIVLPSTYVFLTLLGGNELSYINLYFVGSGAALAGLYLPALVVQAKVDRRREAVVNGFPDCLDLMLVCVEAGLGLESALDRVAREMTLAHPLVAALLTKATLRLRAGASREEALRQMANEAGVDEIRSFSTLLIQSDKLGTSIAITLRVYASEMRERRRMRAEERAHRLPVLISVPLVACMLPTMIGTLMLPAAIRVVRQLFPAMTGGG